jgi:hypothetical protein
VAPEPEDGLPGYVRELREENDYLFERTEEQGRRLKDLEARISDLERQLRRASVPYPRTAAPHVVPSPSAGEGVAEIPLQ